MIIMEWVVPIIDTVALLCRVDTDRTTNEEEVMEIISSTIRVVVVGTIRVLLPTSVVMQSHHPSLG